MIFNVLLKNLEIYTRWILKYGFSNTDDFIQRILKVVTILNYLIFHINSM